MKNVKSILINLSKKNILIRFFLRRIVYLKNKIIVFIYSFNKVADKLVIFESYMGKSFACSPKAIYLEMLNNPKYDEYNFIWCFVDPDKYINDFDNERTTLVKYKSSSYFKAYSRAKYWFSNSRLPFITKKKNSQIYIQCWHGTPFKRIGCDVIDGTKNALNTKADIVKRYENESRRINYFLSQSRTASERFISSFHLNKLGKESIIVEEGYPRNDFLFNYTDDDVFKIKQRLGLDKNKMIILYAPTWRDDKHISGIGYTYQLEINLDYLYEHLSKDYVIIFRNHYLISNTCDLEKYNGFIYDVSKIDDINDLYIISDCLITDYSSVIFDYANLNKPIIFYMYDLNYYNEELRGFYNDFDLLPGDIVTSEEEIVNILKNIDIYNEKYKMKYEKFNKKYNYLDDGKSTSRVLKKLIK